MDRTIGGIVAGIIAGVAKNTWNLLDFYLLHLGRVRFIDWVSVLIRLEIPDSAFLTITYLIINLFFDGLLGAIFANLLLLVTSKHILIKSIYFSVSFWLISKIYVNTFKLPFISGNPNPTIGALSFLFATVIWGIVLGLVLIKLEERYSL